MCLTLHTAEDWYLTLNRTHSTPIFPPKPYLLMMGFKFRLIFLTNMVSKRKNSHLNLLLNNSHCRSNLLKSLRLGKGLTLAKPLARCSNPNSRNHHLKIPFSPSKKSILILSPLSRQCNLQISQALDSNSLNSSARRKRPRMQLQHSKTKRTPLYKVSLLARNLKYLNKGSRRKRPLRQLVSKRQIIINRAPIVVVHLGSRNFLLDNSSH